MNPPITLIPVPTASGAIFHSEDISAPAPAEAQQGHIYAGAIAFSVGAPDNVLAGLLVEQQVDHRPARQLADAQRIEEQDFPVGGPFGA